MPESLTHRLNALPDSATARELRGLLVAAVDDITSLRKELNQLRADYNAHVHGGVTAGAANTTTTTATTAAVVTQTLNK